MKQIPIYDEKTIMENPDGLFNYFAWPTIAHLDKNTLGLVCSGFRLGHVCPFGKVVMAKSTDEGKTWTQPTVIIDTKLDDRDGGILSDENGFVMVTSFNNTIALQQNYANNTQKSDPTYRYHDLVSAYLEHVTLEEQAKYLGSTLKISHDFGVTFGEVKKVKISAPHGPIMLKNGRILYIGRTFTEDPNHPVPDRIECHEIDKTGKTTFLGAIPNIIEEHGPLVACEPHAIECEDGRILVHIRMDRIHQNANLGSFSTWQSVSSDGGKTFSVPKPLLSFRGGAPAHLLRHSSDTLISVYGHRSQPFGIRAMLSKDDGETWDIDYTLTDNSPTFDAGYPATIECQDGSLLTVYYSHVGDCEMGQGATLILDPALHGQVGHTPAVIRSVRWKLPDDYTK